MTGMLRVIMLASGLPIYGVCPFDEFSDKLTGGMAKGRLPENAKSVITALFPCRLPAEEGEEPVFADLPEYHEIASHMLSTASDALAMAFPDYSFVWFLDGSPIPLVQSAARSGLGIIGDNGRLIAPHYGSWCFSGVIVTDLDVPVTAESAGFCDHCGRCREVCPSSAINESGGFDPKVCTGRAGLEPSGCHACMDVCPHNADPEDTPLPAFLSKAKGGDVLGELARHRDNARLYRNPDDRDE